ncbi:aldehyde-activating protein [Sneathiella sp. P13V-1]|uniref:GFA family protein n=1 Tax=Sneathiella sp. P13V-1 TaxID=2697366 RepID=UPI00187B36F8|nr:GFA family protein [Sneathiella sp. P13V-1]MBE7636929.1 aldehyde-activating protein [Sneathiella sp. P13V-1]
MDQMMTGGCACGAIRFECDGEPMHMGNCHCRDCQRATGGPYFPATIYPTENFTLLQGEPNWFEKKSDGGDTVGRAFCGECGSPMFFVNQSAPHIYAIYATAFDDPTFYKAVDDIFVSSAQEWNPRDLNIPQFERSPKRS